MSDLIDPWEDPGVQVRKTRLGWVARGYGHEFVDGEPSRYLWSFTCWRLKRESACAAVRKVKARRAKKVADWTPPQPHEWEPC